MRSERFFKHDLLPFAEVRYSRGSSAPFKLHLHRTLSIGAIDQGEVAYQVGDRKAYLSPGSLALINPEILHACNPVTEKSRSYYMLYLDSDWCLKVQQSMWQVESLVAMEKIRIDDERLYQLYCRTMELLIDDKVHLQKKEQQLFDLVCDVFSLACREPQVIIQSRSGLRQLESMEKLKKLLSADLQKDFPLDLLAGELGANPYTLIRSFKTLTGITPHAYRMNCRIEQAKTYLRAGRDIGQTALDCGFFDQSHFHRHFKAMTTVTPQEYRVNFIQ